MKNTEVGAFVGKAAAKTIVVAKATTEKTRKEAGALAVSILAAAKAAKEAFAEELRNNRS